MKVYRIKHVPTGLYYTTVKVRSVKFDGKSVHVKTNLSENGKVYTHKPNLKHVSGIRNHRRLHKIPYWPRVAPENLKVVDGDLVIEEVEF